MEDTRCRIVREIDPFHDVYLFEINICLFYLRAPEGIDCSCEFLLWNRVYRILVVLSGITAEKKIFSSFLCLVCAVCPVERLKSILLLNVMEAGCQFLKMPKSFLQLLYSKKQ